jgi:hypothetical protein
MNVRHYYDTQTDQDIARNNEKFTEIGLNIHRTPGLTKSKITFREMLVDSYEYYLNKIKNVRIYNFRVI